MFQETFKNFNINFNALNEKSTFSSGDPVTGHVTFDLSKDTKISSISMHLKGEANVHWTTGGGGGRKRRRQRRSHSAKLEFFDLKAVLMQTNSSMHSLDWVGATLTIISSKSHGEPKYCLFSHSKRRLCDT
ncbi:hypothetical protein INR49_006124 [Caranx melampygus]|nr:hypothetical protein INR49_006124 [Caranx melampygus]